MEPDTLPSFNFCSIGFHFLSPKPLAYASNTWVCGDTWNQSRVKSRFWKRCREDFNIRFLHSLLHTDFQKLDALMQMLFLRRKDRRHSSLPKSLWTINRNRSAPIANSIRYHDISLIFRGKIVVFCEILQFGKSLGRDGPSC